MLLLFCINALLKSYGDVVGKATDLVDPKIELWVNKQKKMSFQGHTFNPSAIEKGNFPARTRRNVNEKTHFIEFAFESVVVDIIGDVLQFAMLVEIDNGVVSESIDDFAVVYKLCVD